MTRGKIIFIEKNLRVYSTIEFNGDMYPYDGGHGEEIVGLFQRRGFSDFRSYEHYVKKFDDKNFGYFPAYGMELIQFKGTYREDIFDFTDNYTDYLYLINRSGRDVCVKLEDGKKTIPDIAAALISEVMKMPEVKKQISQGMNTASTKRR
ncbi:MAG: hypothetical protein LUF00_02195 [Lachnospiraceae bacterium]|nr:hypothetical protein [Lachnospiraceae bacterium]